MGDHICACVMSLNSYTSHQLVQGGPLLQWLCLAMELRLRRGQRKLRELRDKPSLAMKDERLWLECWTRLPGPLLLWGHEAQVNMCPFPFPRSLLGFGYASAAHRTQEITSSKCFSPFLLYLFS